MDKQEKNRNGGFSFRNLTVYQRMLEYVRLEHGVARSFPAGSAHIRDQLDRAADSIVLNFCEGAGKKRGSRDRNRYYTIAAASATESVGGWDVAVIRGYIGDETAKHAMDLLSQIKAMLEKMKG